MMMKWIMSFCHNGYLDIVNILIKIVDNICFLSYCVFNRQAQQSISPKTGGVMHPIIFNWMTVRSLTTVFMRAISERGDFQTVFEPFLPIFWNARKDQAGNGHVENYDGWPTDYAGIRAKIFSMAEKGPVFIKEAPLHAIEEFLKDEDLLRRRPTKCSPQAWG